MRKLLKSAVRRHRKRKNLRLGLKSRDPFVIVRNLIASETPLIFDVGAHVGLAAARYRELFPLATIHCFEPFPEAFEVLKSSVGSLTPIEFHNVAIAAAEGQAEFSVNRNSATNSLLASHDDAAMYWRKDAPKTTNTLAVPTTTIDGFARQNSISSIDILKIDVQGGEYDVLKGAGELLRQQAIGLIYMELITAPTYVGQHRMREYLELFDAAGYELFDFYNVNRRDGRLIQTDIIVINPETLRNFEQRLANPA
jgi:FkbM family methyltransferase